MRETLTRFVDRDVSPRDLIVVMKPLDSLFAIRLTRDREAVRRAIESFEGRKGDYEPRNAYERDYIAGTPARIDVARSSGGAVRDQRARGAPRQPDRSPQDADRRDGERRPRRPPARPGVSADARHDHPLGEPLQRGGLPVRSARGRRRAGGEGLRRLADETDGEAIAADAEPGLRRVAADSSAYYLLSFRTAHPDDGKFRELQARVNAAGAVVRARKGLLDGVAG